MQENFGGKKLWQMSLSGILARITWQIKVLLKFDLKHHIFNTTV